MGGRSYNVLGIVVSLVGTAGGVVLLGWVAATLVIKVLLWHQHELGVGFDPKFPRILA